MGVIDENVAKQNIGFQFGTNLLSTGLNWLMYEKQKRDSIDFWNKQNSYNTPQMQMGRYRAAGLNPNLIYGKTGDNSASTIDRPSMQSTSYVAPKNEYSKAENLMAMANVENAKKTNSLLDEQIEKNRAERALIAAQTGNVSTDTEQKKFQLGMSNELRSTSVDYQRESLRKLTNEADNIIKRYKLDSVMQEHNIRNIASQVLRRTSENSLTTAQIGKITNEVETIKLENDMRKVGINPSDPAWSRILVRLFDVSNIKDKSIDEKIKELNQKILKIGHSVSMTILDNMNPFSKTKKN